MHKVCFSNRGEVGGIKRTLLAVGNFPLEILTAIQNSPNFIAML